MENVTSAASGIATIEEATDLVSSLLLDDARLVKASLSGGRRNVSPPWRRVTFRYVDLKAGRRLQVTRYDQTQAHIGNLDPSSAAADVAALMRAGFANWHVEAIDETIQVRISKKGRPLISRKARVAPVVADASHDRSKHPRLPPDDAIFVALGISTADGRIKPTRVSKFHQVQDFLAALDPAVTDLIAARHDHLEPNRPLTVADLGCGNAYLTLAAYRYLQSVKHQSVRVVGVDVKEQSRQHNDEIADALSLVDMSFVASAIATAEIAPAPDVVLALHACDTATDDALARAVGWRARVVLAAPCCHHDIQRQLAGRESPDPYQLVTGHAILRERLADVLTDALRAAILRLVGYRVDVIEFVESRHTPRNTLIRAVYTGSAATTELALRYQALTADWGVRPALAGALECLGIRLPAISSDHTALV